MRPSSAEVPTVSATPPPAVRTSPLTAPTRSAGDGRTSIGGRVKSPKGVSKANVPVQVPTVSATPPPAVRTSPLTAPTRSAGDGRTSIGGRVKSPKGVSKANVPVQVPTVSATPPPAVRTSPLTAPTRSAGDGRTSIGGRVKSPKGVSKANVISGAPPAGPRTSVVSAKATAVWRNAASRPPAAAPRLTVIRRLFIRGAPFMLDGELASQQGEHERKLNTEM